MEAYTRLLLANRAWVQERERIRPGFFERLAKDQKPDFLWIGCSDSRVPAEEVTGTDPGEIFVHRNIANQVWPTDLNLMSVLQYAVGALKVEHVIVCGHYGCGGVKAAMKGGVTGHIAEWLRMIEDIQRAEATTLEAALDEDAKTERLVELNVHRQLQNLAGTETIQRAWQDEGRPVLHGWVYDLRDGLLHDLEVVTPPPRGA
jgi:carbonic anhydrase